ncbi:MAG: hypothetical protein SF029_13095 [bacterium]|nr:hypothetical protein [bacterium]
MDTGTDCVCQMDPLELLIRKAIFYGLFVLTLVLLLRNVLTQVSGLYGYMDNIAAFLIWGFSAVNLFAVPRKVVISDHFVELTFARKILVVPWDRIHSVKVLYIQTYVFSDTLFLSHYIFGAGILHVGRAFLITSAYSNYADAVTILRRKVRKKKAVSR